MSAALPLGSKGIKSGKYHTAIGLALCQGLCKLWPHVDIEMLVHFIFDSSSFHAAINHGLDPNWIQSVKDITDPLLVNVDPVARVWHVPEHIDARLCMFEEVSHSEAFYLKHCCNLDCISLDVLNMAYQCSGNFLPPSFQT